MNIGAQRVARPLAPLLILLCYSAAQAELSGYVSAQLRAFPDDSAYVSQSDTFHYSAVIEPEWYFAWNDRDDSLTFEPFLRVDSQDPERTHGDVRELFWLHAAKNWELGAGVGKVFWGVTESQHLVDIVNQTDLVESPDGEDKLGQPMVQLSLISDWGVLDAFWLPYFRTRTFPGEKGRLRGELVVDTDNERYQSSDEETHQDFAIRWSNIIGPWDIAASWFKGTGREPMLMPNTQGRLTPFYPQISQAGLEAQLTVGSWLWKLEALYQDSDFDNFAAAIGGFEYTFVGIFGSIFDLGVLMEYSWDERAENSTTGFQNDLFVGGRFTFNDEASSEILFGVIRDLDYPSSYAGFVEASQRVGDATKIYLEARLFDSEVPSDPLFQLRQDKFVELTVEYYF